MSKSNLFERAESNVLLYLSQKLNYREMMENNIKGINVKLSNGSQKIDRTIEIVNFENGVLEYTSDNKSQCVAEPFAKIVLSRLYDLVNSGKYMVDINIIKIK